MVILLGDRLAAGVVGAFHRRVLAVQHDVIMDIDAMFNPVAARLCVRAFNDELIQHVLYGPGDRHWLLLGVDPATTCWTRLLVGLLGVPSMLQALAAEHVLAGELDRLVERRHTDQADENLAAVGLVLELVDVGRELGDATFSMLRRRGVGCSKRKWRRIARRATDHDICINVQDGCRMACIAGGPRAAPVVRWRDGFGRRHGRRRDEIGHLFVLLGDESRGGRAIGAVGVVLVVLVVGR